MKPILAACITFLILGAPEFCHGENQYLPDTTSHEYQIVMPKTHAKGTVDSNHGWNGQSLGLNLNGLKSAHVKYHSISGVKSIRNDHFSRGTTALFDWQVEHFPDSNAAVFRIRRSEAGGAWREYPLFQPDHIRAGIVFRVHSSNAAVEIVRGQDSYGAGAGDVLFIKTIPGSLHEGRLVMDLPVRDLSGRIVADSILVLPALLSDGFYSFFRNWQYHIPGVVWVNEVIEVRR